jgi:hypothetical protein
MLAKEYDASVGSLCDCGVDGRTRTCRCMDCFQSPVTCEQCFIQAHTTQPYHWVEQWNGSFFVRRDISALGHIVHLGHHGHACHNHSSTTESIQFTVVHTNGVHATRLAFCACVGAGNRRQQLLKAQLFPATVDQPVTAFTFNVLHEYHIHSLESKQAAYSYMRALQRLTNNTFTDDVSVSDNSLCSKLMFS